MSWQRNFTEHSTRIAFNLTLTRKMIFYLEIIEDFNNRYRRTQDDEYRTEEGLNRRNDFVPGFRALEARGLAEQNSLHNTHRQRGQEARYGDKRPVAPKAADFSWYYRLTPAGEAVMTLLRISGLVRPAVIEGGKEVA